MCRRLWGRLPRIWKLVRNCVPAPWAVSGTRSRLPAADQKGLGAWPENAQNRRLDGGTRFLAIYPRTSKRPGLWKAADSVPEAKPGSVRAIWPPAALKQLPIFADNAAQPEDRVADADGAQFVGGCPDQARRCDWWLLTESHMIGRIFWSMVRRIAAPPIPTA